MDLSIPADVSLGGAGGGQALTLVDTSALVSAGDGGARSLTPQLKQFARVVHEINNIQR